MDKKTNRSFWIVFAVIILLAGISTVTNLWQFNTRNKLNTEGLRIRCVVDSVQPKDGKWLVFVTFNVNGKTYVYSKKMKKQIAAGDSVSVYYLPDDPGTHDIADEP